MVKHKAAMSLVKLAANKKPRGRCGGVNFLFF